ncbi:MAG: insulinase family protein [Pedosphaera sp.]|nr:insulinase family protein [Pedosphaera sp.]
MTRILALLLAFVVTSGFAASIPDRPEKLKHAPLNFEPPRAVDYRVQLKSGPVAYIVPNRELPLVSINILVRTGDYVVPAGKEGLAGFVGSLLTTGGTAKRPADQIEERMAFLAAQLGSGVADTQGSVGINLLSKDLAEGLAVLREVLTEPAFQEDKLELLRQQSLQGMKQRNDNSSSIEVRERRNLAYGENFWSNRAATEASVKSITQADLQKFHRDWFHPGNFVIAVSGDVDRAAMEAALEKLCADWPFTGKAPPPVPKDKQFAKPGLYIVDKDVNQGRVSVLLPGIQRDDPDTYAVEVMNDILGGGGFTSRIVNRVRSDEGLAYSAGSGFPEGLYYPLSFVAAFQSKSGTVPYATSIVIEEMKKISTAPVTAEELETTKRSAIETFPRSFATKGQVASTLAQDEFTGRYASNPDYHKNYRAKISAVTAADVQRVAKRFFTLDKLVILVVGQKAEILKGHPDHPMKFEGLVSGPLVDVPIRDPLTLKPLQK